MPMEAVEISLQYGFGPECMKRLKICPHCSRPVGTENRACPHCGRKVPVNVNNLFQYYKSMHRRCPSCDTVLSERMKYCPHCGMKQTNDHQSSRE